MSLHLRHGIAVRAARPADAEPLLSVLCAAFDLDCDAARPLFYQDPYYDLSLKRVLITPEHGVVSCLTIIPTTLNIGGTRIPVGGIAGVATLPGHQQKGYASRLLAETTHAFAAELHYPVSALFPYSETFYRRLGWESASRAMCWSGFLPCEAGARLASRVRLLRPENGYADREAIRRLHASAPTDQVGLCRRDARRWQILETMNAAWEWLLYEVRGKVTGYAACERVSGDEPIVRVHELIASSEDARRGLMGFLSCRCGPRTFISWTAAPGQHAQFDLPNSPEQMTAVPEMMLRITDLPAALQYLHAAYAPVLVETGRSLTIIAADDVRPENEQPLLLSSAGVTRDGVVDGDWMRADIRTLAQFFTGYRLPSEFAAQDEASFSSPAAIALADAVFPRRNPFIAPADHF